MLSTIWHQYISAANIKKIREIGLLVLPVCISLPIGWTGSFPPICGHCNENPIYLFPEKELRGLSPYFHIHVSVRDSYIPRIGHIFPCNRIGRQTVGIYKSLTDTWMWKLGLRPRKSFSGNFCFKFSVLCLCSGCNCMAQHQYTGGTVSAAPIYWWKHMLKN